MNHNDETFYEDVNIQIDKSQAEDNSVNFAESSNFKKRALMLGGAILAGASIGGGIAYANTHSGTKEEIFEILDEDDDKSFEEAFNDAREKLGLGAAFRWHGGVYNTYTEEEWENMSEEERENYYNKVRPLMSDDDLKSEHYSTRMTTHEHEDHHVSRTSTNIPPKPAPTPEPNEYKIESEKEMELQGQKVIVANGTHNGKPAFFIDLNLDGKYDVIAEDINADGNLTEDEYKDIRSENITVTDKSLIGGATPIDDELTIIEEAETEIHGRTVIMARAEHNGQPAVLIDADRDGKYDVAIEDRNHDNQLTEEDYHDIRHMDIRVQDTSLIGGDDSEPVVEIDYQYESLTEEGVISTVGRVDGKQAVIIDTNKDGTYDVAYVDKNDNNQLDENERTPVNIVSTGTRVHNETLIDGHLTDTNLDDENKPDYVNNLDGASSDEVEVEITTDAPQDDTTYTASIDNDDTMGEDSAAAHYNDMTFNDPTSTDAMPEMTDDYGMLS